MNRLQTFLYQYYSTADYKHTVKHPSAVSVHHLLPSVATTVHSDLSSTFQVLSSSSYE